MLNVGDPLLHPNNLERNRELAEASFKMFGMNRHQGFEFDLSHKTLLYEGLLRNYNKPVRLIVDAILNKLNDGLYQELLL